MPRILHTVVAALAAAQTISAHTWIEQLRNVDEKGAYIGGYGYPRGMVSKTDPGFNGFSMNYQLPNVEGGKIFIDEQTPLCHEQQRKQVQSSDKYPRLQATPGGFIAMRYMENGHVSLPNNQKGKPAEGGTVFVYGTTEPKTNETLTTVLQWDNTGKAGDGRGVLLGTNNFDDGRCYEKNNSPISQDRAKADPNFALGQVSNGPGNYPLFCETNIQLPKTAATGKPYTLYWVWQWNTAPGGVDPNYPKGKDEYYTTCMDVDMTSNLKVQSAKDSTKFALGPQQDAMSIAVADFASRTAVMTNAIKGEVGPFFNSEPTPSPNGPGSAQPQNPSAPTGTVKPPQQTGIPNRSHTKSRRPRPTQQPQPSQQPAGGNGPVVTVTDTVFLTVTASGAAGAPPAGTTTPAAGKPSASGQTPAAPQPSASGKLPGFNRPNGAKFRRMYNA